eukprot:GHVU01207245.1.p1 GENE.GHVU01207245.1~~GHVU01207245.1.p1  ORF type:complete len:213 (-),score=44.14 GHVU01207245.1:143-781(-)
MPPKKAPVKPGASKGPVKGKPAAKKPAAAAAAKKPEPVKEEAPPVWPNKTISLRELANVVLTDVNNVIKDTGKFPMLIDTVGQAATFLKYRDANYINAVSQEELQAERLRLALIGAIRYGKPMVVDMMEADLFVTVGERFDEVKPGLLNSVLDKSFLKDDAYMELVRPTEGDEYSIQNFRADLVENFQFILITQMETPPVDLLRKTYSIRIE